MSGLYIEIKEKRPTAVFCHGFHEERIEDEKNCYFSDNNGYIYSVAIESSAHKYMRYYISNSDFNKDGKTIIGNNFIDREKFKRLKIFSDGISKAGLIPIGILINDNNQYEMYIKGNPETIIYFDDKAPLENTLDNVLTFLKDIKSKNQKIEDLDYINLRFGKNIFYSNK